MKIKVQFVSPYKCRNPLQSINREHQFRKADVQP